VVRVRDHIALSTAGAALLGPSVGPGVLGFWAGSVLIDLDHYLWFCVHERRVSPVAAVRFFGAAHAPQRAATRVLHHPLMALTLLLLAARRRRLLPITLGMGLHIALDAHHEARMDDARAAALERDDFSCQTCGARGPAVETHLRRQPWVLASYGPQNLIALCGSCHEAAHARGRNRG
jgi:hypothetical protein